MALSKSQSNEDKNHRRDAFDERICDDLSEVILQFLSLEDKIKLQCVSKQFQRTVFCKQQTLVFDFWRDEEWIENLGILLQKLPAITSIKYKYDYNRREVNKRGDNCQPKQISDETIELIIKNCNNLTHFDYNLFHFVGKDIQIKFFERFGHKLLSADVDKSLLWCLNEMPNIEELSVESDNYYLPDIQFKRLKSFKYYTRVWNSDTIFGNFEVFIERNANTITHLDINFFARDNFERLATIVSNVKNLVHLKVDPSFRSSYKSLKEGLTQIAVNCNQLKSLEITYGLNEDFSPLIQFKQLKRLVIHFGKNSSEWLRYIMNDNRFFPFKELKPLSELTHICFYLNDYRDTVPNFTDRIFTDIDINFPKLQSLAIIGMKVKPNERTVDKLSRLSRLESIEFWFDSNDQWMETKIRSQLTKNCKNVRKLELKFEKYYECFGY